MDIDSNFRKEAKKLSSPTSKYFNASEWVHKLFASRDIGSSDLALIKSALWINKEFKTLQESIPLTNLEQIGKETAIYLAVAVSNITYDQLRKHMQHSLKAIDNSKAVSFDFILNRPVHEDGDGRKLSIDDINENMVDAIESWLYDARKFDEAYSDEVDLNVLSNLYTFKYNIQHALNDTWSAIIWQGWSIQENKDEIVLAPYDRNFIVRDRAWHARHSANFMSAAALMMNSWPFLEADERRRLADYRTVLRIDDTGSRRRLRVGRVNSQAKVAPPYLVTRSAVEASYVNQFMSINYPKYPTLNSWTILEAWYIITDMANILAKSFRSSDKLHNDNLSTFSLTVSASEITNLLCSSLSLSADIIRTIIDFLTYNLHSSEKFERSDIWAAALIKTPKNSIYLLCLPVLNTSNTVRKIERWFLKGGIDDVYLEKSKGLQYEAELRKKLYDLIIKNAKLQNSGCLPHAVKKNNQFSEEIDLIIKISDTLLVCDIKCFVFPSDSHSKNNLYKKLRRAAIQAVRKCEAVRNSFEYIRAQFLTLEIDIQDCRLLPLVITNHGFGTGLRFGDCIVTDAHFMSTYLSGEDLVTSSVTDGSGEQLASSIFIYYNDEKEAGENMLKYCSNPPVLNQYIDRIYWEKTIFPVASNKPFFIEKAAIGDTNPINAMVSRLIISERK